MKLPKIILTSLVASSLAVVAGAGNWSARLGATYLVTVDGSSNDAVPVEIEDKVIPEFDITYAFNQNWSAELVLTIPQEHSVETNGTPLGDFKHLPPTLLAKYTFTTNSGFKPYVGAGVNFTLIFDEDLAVGATELKLDSYSVGPAVQVGFDWAVDEKWSLNADVKRAMLRSDVKAGGTKITEARLDPWLFSIGARYAF